MPRSAPTKKGVTRGQLALIGLLAIIFAGVMWSNFTSGAGDAEVATPGEAAPPSISGQIAAAPNDSSPFGEFAEDQSWPATSVAELASFDPFSDGQEDLQTTPQYDAAELNELRNAQDAIILTSDGETVALIGAKQYRVGDIVAGFEITEISSAGIVLGQRH